MARLLALLLCLTVWTTTAFAQDGLQQLNSRRDLLGWEGVGRLDLAGGAFCTGVLIDTSTVLTAAHCLYDPKTGAFRMPGDVTFRAGFQNGSVIAERAAAQAVVDENYVYSAQGVITQFRNDIALITLDDPIPSATARPFATATPNGGSVSVVSYGAGRLNASSRERDCNTLVQGDGLVALDCNGVPGSSGAPVFTIDGSAIRIVSIIAGGALDSGRSVSVGPFVHERLPELRQALRAGRGIWDTDTPAARTQRPGDPASTNRPGFIRP